MTATDTRLRSVLAEPRGHRFSRPGATPHHPTPRRSHTRTSTRAPATPSPTRSAPTRPAPTPGTTPDNPSLPESSAARRARLLRQMEGNPRVAYMLEHGELPRWFAVARRLREQAERETKRIEDAWAAAHAQVKPVVRPGRHRATRQWWSWPAVAIGTALLLGQMAAEAVGQEVVLKTGFLV